LLADGATVYFDTVIRDGTLQPFRGMQRATPAWDFDFETLSLLEFDTGIDALIGLAEAFGTNYQVMDNGNLPNDSIVFIAGYDDGVFVGGGLAQLVSLTTSLVGGDNDGDGVDVRIDNCQNVANANQRDTDGDGIGNICDPDIAVPNNCVVNALDLGIFKLAFFSQPASGNWNADADFNGDDVVNVIDLGVLKSLFFQVPGPSGMPNICDP